MGLCARFFTPFKAGLTSGLLTFGAASIYSVFQAFQLSAYCKSIALEIINSVGNNFTIEDLATTIDYKRYSFNITLDDMHGSLPENWVDLLKKSNNFAPYCFSIPFAFDMLTTSILSLTVGEVVALLLICRQLGKIYSNNDEERHLLINA